MTPLEVQQLRKALDDRDLEPASRQIILQRLSGGEAPVTGPTNIMDTPRGPGSRDLGNYVTPQYPMEPPPYVQAGRGMESRGIAPNPKGQGFLDYLDTGAEQISKFRGAISPYNMVMSNPERSAIMAANYLPNAGTADAY